MLNIAFFFSRTPKDKFFFVLQWICLLFSHKCSIGMCSSHGICESLNWPLPLLSQGLNFEKITKKPSEPLEIHIDSPVSQRLGKIKLHILNLSLGGMKFWNPIMSFLESKIWFPKRRKFFYFLCFVHLPNCQSLSNRYDFQIYVVSR